MNLEGRAIAPLDTVKALRAYPGGGEQLLRDMHCALLASGSSYGIITNGQDVNLGTHGLDDLDRSTVELFATVLYEYLTGFRLSAVDRQPTARDHVRSLDEAFQLRRHRSLPRSPSDLAFRRMVWMLVEANRREKPGEKREPWQRLSGLKFVKGKDGLPMTAGRNAIETVFEAVSKYVAKKYKRILHPKSIERIHREERRCPSDLPRASRIYPDGAKPKNPRQGVKNSHHPKSK